MMRGEEVCDRVCARMCERVYYETSRVMKGQQGVWVVTIPLEPLCPGRLRDNNTRGGEERQRLTALRVRLKCPII